MVTLEADTDGWSTAPGAQIIHHEKHWLDISSVGAASPPRPGLLASRWVGQSTDGQPQESDIDPDCHILAVALRPMEEVTVFAARKLITSGHMPQGAMRVHEPGTRMRGIFRGPWDALHLRIPNSIVEECARVDAGQRRRNPLVTDHPVVDPIVERLSRAFVHAEELGAFGQCFADGISLAITAQLFGSGHECCTGRSSRVSGLSKWRLKRATEYMAANLSEPIGLVDIANAAGLSRMHFAAQFRVATGLRPHEYLIRKRIERAQELLTTTSVPLVEIAFEVGFKTQAHFTTVFAQHVGETPKVWRQRHGSMTANVSRFTNGTLASPRQFNLS